MSDARTLFFFDFVDPGSYLMELRLGALSAEGTAVGIDRVPFELRPFPEPMVDPADPAWIAYWRQMADELAAEGVPVAPASRVPWTRKAHELVLLADESALGDRARRAIFQRFHERGDDIGRVDVLLQVARELGLDPTVAKATLDVDRFAEHVEARRTSALRRGVRGVPSLVHEDRTLEGVHGMEAIRRFLEGTPPAE